MSQQKPIPRAVIEESAAPIYITTEDDFTGPHGDVRPDFFELTRGVPAMRGHWRCLYCGLDFTRRKPCEMHMGLRANIPASCSILDKKKFAQ
jgi:hypothetical protein